MSGTATTMDELIPKLLLVEKEEIALHQYCIELEFKKTQACHGMGHLIIYIIWRSAI